jgi:predicted regulator of Ras-like GTPase activity (Roadblock/LC7/MglB family)
MNDVLIELNKTSGIRGSMVVGSDGIIIAADLNTEYEDDTVGALAASIVAGIKKAISRLESGMLRHVMIEAEEGKVFLAESQKGILVVMAEKDVNIGLIRLEMNSAVEKLQKTPVVAQ